MRELTWGVAPNGVVEVAHEDIALVHLNEGILPPLGDCSLSQTCSPADAVHGSRGTMSTNGMPNALRRQPACHYLQFLGIGLIRCLHNVQQPKCNASVTHHVMTTCNKTVFKDFTTTQKVLSPRLRSGHDTTPTQPT